MFYMSAPLDGRIFAYQVLQRLCLVVCWPPWYLAWLLWQGNCLDAQWVMMVLQTSTALMWVLVLPLSMARIHGVAKISPWLAQALVARGLRSTCRCQELRSQNRACGDLEQGEEHASDQVGDRAQAGDASISPSSVHAGSPAAGMPE
mmetsp:Transcript_539/g.1295  ORF Transcript_539/g.1295 Transcript_539/m.1295 type:complete len:147 (+) Transcript_539:3-443(+)